MSIQEHLDKIRNAVYGREVRESIAKGIETAYDDASENGNANMEVKMARGTNPNLNTRLNKMEETDRQTTAQLAQTRHEAYRKRGLNDLTPEVLSAIEGGEGTSFNLLSEPREKSVTPVKTTFIKKADNLFDGNFLLDRGVLGSSPNYTFSEIEGAVSLIIEVKPNTIYVITKDLNTPRHGIFAMEEYPELGENMNARLINGTTDAFDELIFETGANERYIVAYLSNASYFIPSFFQIEEGFKPTAFDHYKTVDLKLGKETKEDIENSLSFIDKDGVNLWDGSYYSGVALLESYENLQLVKDDRTTSGVTLILKLQQNTDYTAVQQGADRFRIALNDTLPKIGDVLDKTLVRGFDLPPKVHFNSENFNYIVVQISGEGNTSNFDFQLEYGSEASRIEKPNAVTLHTSNKFMNELKNELEIEGPTKSIERIINLNVPEYEITSDPIDPNVVNSNVEDMYAFYDSLIEEEASYTKSVLGNEPTGLPINRYDFKMYDPVQGSVPNPSKKPKVIIIGGTHGHEKPAREGTLRYFSDLVYNWKENPSLRAVRQHLHLVLVPALNPYGILNDQRTNSNGVDLNRNFPENFVYAGEGTNYYSGEDPLSEEESKIIDELLRTEEDVVFVIDFHNQGNFYTDNTISYLAMYDNELVKSMFPMSHSLDGILRMNYPAIENHERNLVDTHGKRLNDDGALYKHFFTTGHKGAILEVTGNINTTSEDVQEINALVLGNLLVNIANGLYTY